MNLTVQQRQIVYDLIKDLKVHQLYWLTDDKVGLVVQTVWYATEGRKVTDKGLKLAAACLQLMDVPADHALWLRDFVKS